MRFILNLIDLCLSLPWWGALAVLVSLAAFVYLSGVWFKWKFHKIVHEAVLEAGSALKGAEAKVHAVAAVPAPGTPSPYDIAEDDEHFDPEADGQPWGEDDGHYYSIDVTITPADPATAWDPTGLAVVPADFEPEDPTDVCGQMGGLHSAEVWTGEKFVPLPEGEVRGPKRLRLLIGVPEGVRAVKFANLVTYFGHVDLPAPLPAKAAK
jgi:hypothetical protein